MPSVHSALEHTDCWDLDFLPMSNLFWVKYCFPSAVAADHMIQVRCGGCHDHNNAKCVFPGGRCVLF